MSSQAERLGHPFPLEALSIDERERWAGFRVQRAADEYLCAHLLKRHVLSRYLPIAPAAWCFERSMPGKPAIDTTLQERLRTSREAPLHFSLSHSGGVCAMLVSRHSACGVDIEPASRSVRLGAQFTRTFAPSEQAVLAACNSSQRGEFALRLWTLKEAWAKAVGAGLSLDFSSFACGFNEDGRPRLSGIAHGGCRRFATQFERGQFEIGLAWLVDADVTLAFDNKAIDVRVAELSLPWSPARRTDVLAFDPDGNLLAPAHRPTAPAKSNS